MERSSAHTRSWTESSPRSCSWTKSFATSSIERLPMNGPMWRNACSSTVNRESICSVRYRSSPPPFSRCRSPITHHSARHAEDLGARRLLPNRRADGAAGPTLGTGTQSAGPQPHHEDRFRGDRLHQERRPRARQDTPPAASARLGGGLWTQSKWRWLPRAAGAGTGWPRLVDPTRRGTDQPLPLVRNKPGTRLSTPQQQRRNESVWRRQEGLLESPDAPCRATGRH